MREDTASHAVANEEIVVELPIGLQLFTGGGDSKKPIQFNIVKPTDLDTGDERTQYQEMAQNMRYAAGCNLPVLKLQEPKTGCRAVIVAAGPSVETQVEQIRLLASDSNNAVFAINWAHTWLINNNVVPHGCLLFEVDAEPIALMETLHKDVTYYVCSHCNTRTFKDLEGHKVVLWHNSAEDPLTQAVLDECFRNQLCLGGSYLTFLRTISLALTQGYRDFDIFGADSSYPIGGDSTHVEGYPAAVTDRVDGMDIYARNPRNGEVRAFKSVSYLAHQVEEFRKYCAVNHWLFHMRLHGDGLLQWEHRVAYPQEYERIA